MKESVATARILLDLRRLLPNAVIFKHADYSTAGIPDFSVTISGQTLFFEVKAERGKLSKLQEHTLARLNKAGVQAFTLRFCGSGLKQFLVQWPNGCSVVSGTKELAKFIQGEQYA